VHSNRMMESASDSERDGNDLRMNDVDEQEDDEEEMDDNEGSEDANEDEDVVDDEANRLHIERQDQSDRDNEIANEVGRADAYLANDANRTCQPQCSESSDMCQMDVQPIGCYKDITHSLRALPELLVSHRDETSPVFSNLFFQWKKGGESIKKLLCECVAKARQRGMPYVGLQNFGECWSSNNAAKDYPKRGRSSRCVNGSYKKCKAGQFCIGKAFTNYVYSINSLLRKPCNVNYKTVGCFHDPVHVKRRPLPYLLESRRDKSSKVYTKPINWKNYHASLSDLVCSCAKRAKAKGYKYFGIQYFGECWSGPGNDSYKKHKRPGVCKSAAFQACKVGAGSRDCFCTGDQHSNYVYQLG